MQYILSQKEYDDLGSVPARMKADHVKELQLVCTLAADNIPVKFWGNKEAKVWGCILSGSHGYCDECLVKKVCPYQFKQWSK